MSTEISVDIAVDIAVDSRSSVNCRWYIGQLSFEYQSCVNLSGESNGFFLSKDVINYCSWHALRARNTHLLLSGFDLLHHAKFSLVQRPQIKVIYFCIEDGNSPLFNDQLLIKRADNAPRKVTKYPADWTHSFIVGYATFSLHYPVLLLCPFALYLYFVQNRDDHAYTEINIEW